MYLRSQNKQTSEVDAMGPHSAQVMDALQLGAELRTEDEALLHRVAESLNLLADVSHADLLMFVKSGDRSLAVAQAMPTSVPPLYSGLVVGEAFDRRSAPVIHRALFEGHMAHAVKGLMIRGAPTIQETFPIYSSRGELIAVLSIEMNLLEYERRRKKSPIIRHALDRLRQKILTGQLKGAAELPRLGEHSASLVVDSESRILYMSSLAEQFYRKVGYTSRLVGRRLSELDTNEDICFKAMERDHCLEEQVEEHQLVWIKWAIPLSPEPPQGLMARLLRKPGSGGALVLIQDVTEERKKDQALLVKSALIREIHHRVKNNLQTIAALLRMQARRTGSPEVLDMLQQSINRVLSIALVHEFLSKEDGIAGEPSLISIREVTQQMLSEVTQGILDPNKRINISLEGGDFSLPPQQTISCVLVVNELLQNAVEHGFESKNEGTVRVILREENDQMVIQVIDDGQGLPPNFDMERDGSLGLQIIQTLVREDLKGRFELTDGGGVHARIAFPRPAGAESRNLASQS